MDQPSHLLLHRRQRRGRQRRALDVRVRGAGGALAARIQAWRPQARGYHHRRWLSREERLEHGRRPPRHARRRPHCFRSLRRRWRPSMTTNRARFASRAGSARRAGPFGPAGLTLAIITYCSIVAFAQGLTVQDFKSNRPTPRMANGKPDFSGYWKGTTDTKPVGNIGKDLPGWKLPLTPAGEAALKHNLTATIDPESLCIIGGTPRHNARGPPIQGPTGKQQHAL